MWEVYGWKKIPVIKGCIQLLHPCCHCFSPHADLSHSLLSLRYLQCMEPQVLLKNNVIVWLTFYLYMQEEESKVSGHVKRRHDQTKVLIRMIQQRTWSYLSTLYTSATRMNLSDLAMVYSVCRLLLGCTGFLFAIRNHSEMLPAKVQKSRELPCYSCVLQGRIRVAALGCQAPLFHPLAVI